MKIALVQMDVLPGHIEKNMRKVIGMIERAKEAGVDLVVFPELCISGYILSDLWVNESFCNALMECNRQIQEASMGIAVAYGNIYLDREINARWKDRQPHPNKDGRTRKYNAVNVVQNGRLARRIKDSALLPAGVHPKTLLPQYRIFDDERYFFSLQDVAMDANVLLSDIAQPFIIEIEGKDVRIGFEVCEDLWCNDYRKNGEPLNVTNMLIDNGAEMIVNISASPWNHGKNSSRDSRIRFLKEQAGKMFVPLLYVNNVGVQNNGKNIITFDGGTTVYNKEGKPVLMAERSYKEEMVLVEDSVLNTAALIRREEPKILRKYEAIIAGIRHMSLFRPEGEPLRFVIGLSGGIDSSVVACLLTIACGKENVTGISMPSVHNASGTRNAAKKVADNLGIDFYIVPIDSLVKHHHIFDEYDKIFNPTSVARDLSEENIQAKIRGTSILSNFAGRYDRYFTCNGNKLEIALGYNTLYGDVNGAIAPIGDLTKTEVYDMARFLNNEIFNEEIIPSNLLPDSLFTFDKNWIVPSAELKKDQVDPIRFGYHCALLECLTDYIRKTPEDILKWYIDGQLETHLAISHDLILRWGIDEPLLFVQDLEWFVSTIQKNIFKRIQAPPIIITSRSSYGYDIRESMLPYFPTSEYIRLKSEVLKLEKYCFQS